MQIFRGQRLLKLSDTRSIYLKYEKEMQKFLNTIKVINHCKTLDDEVFFFAYGNPDKCNKLKDVKKEDIQDLFEDWSGWEYFTNKIHLTDFFTFEESEAEELFCLILLSFEKILISSFPNYAFAIFITYSQELWEDEGESENYIYSTFRFAKYRSGEPLWVEPKYLDEKIIFARVGSQNDKTTKAL